MSSEDYEIFVVSALEDCEQRNKKNIPKFISFLKHFETFLNSVAKNDNAKVFQKTNSIIKEFLSVDGGINILTSVGFEEKENTFKRIERVTSEDFQLASILIQSFIEKYPQAGLNSQPKKEQNAPSHVNPQQSGNKLPSPSPSPSPPSPSPSSPSHLPQNNVQRKQSPNNSPKNSDDQNLDILKVMEMLMIPIERALPLLNHFHWDVTRLLEDFFDMKNEKLFHEAGVSLNGEIGDMRDDLTQSMRNLNLSTSDAIKAFIGPSIKNPPFPSPAPTPSPIAEMDEELLLAIQLSEQEERLKQKRAHDKYQEEYDSVKRTIEISKKDSNLHLQEKKNEEDEDLHIAMQLNQIENENINHKKKEVEEKNIDDLETAIAISKIEVSEVNDSEKKEIEEFDYALEISKVEVGGINQEDNFDQEVYKLASKFRQFERKGPLADRIVKIKSQGHYHESNASAFRTDNNAAEFLEKLSKKRIEVDEALGLKESGHVFVPETQNDIEKLHQNTDHHRISELATKFDVLLKKQLNN